MSKLIDTIAEAIQDKKGKNIISLDLSGFDGAICPAFVICNADSTTQVEAIAGESKRKRWPIWAKKYGASKESPTAYGS